MTKQENKNSAKKKLIPAVAMLTTSAVMLSTSTYAWFTMSREVEVSNIQMTATTPEDIQISLGAIRTPSETNSLTNNGGYLSGDVPATDTDWSNIADISHYYRFGKLIPASSTNGLNIFFTPDSAGVGRTMKTGAKFYQAAAGSQINKTGTESAVSGVDDDKACATAHIVTGADDKWGSATETNTYAPSLSWNDTNDDGYYVDIPVWLRTSSSNEQIIYVYGFACDKTEEGNNDTDDLYQAVRVAILSDNTPNQFTAGTYTAAQGCLTLKDGDDEIGDQSDTNRASMYPQYSNDTNILDSINYNNRTSVSSGIYAVSDLGTGNAGNWNEIAQNNGDVDHSVVTLPAGNGATFGATQKLIVRVWIEGEDGNCWNENANQDWNISLKFTKDPLTANNS